LPDIRACAARRGCAIAARRRRLRVERDRAEMAAGIRQRNERRPSRFAARDRFRIDTFPATASIPTRMGAPPAACPRASTAVARSMRSRQRRRTHRIGAHTIFRISPRPAHPSMSSPVHGASGDTMKTNTTVSIGAAARADSSTATPFAAAGRRISRIHRADALDANPATPVRTRAACGRAQRRRPQVRPAHRRPRTATRTLSASRRCIRTHRGRPRAPPTAAAGADGDGPVARQLVAPPAAGKRTQSRRREPALPS
jgi:hypothetical protein